MAHSFARGITFQGTHKKKETYKGFSDREKAIVDLVTETFDASELNNATFNNIFVFFQHGALIYNFELKKKNGVWQVTKIRIPDQQGGEI